MFTLGRRALSVVAIVAAALVGGTVVEAQLGHGQGQGRGRGMMMDDTHQADMRLLHALFEHRGEIERQVTVRVDGVETLTESDNPEVAQILQEHVESMLARVREARPIHQRDPLFREIFRNAGKIVARHERTPKGVRVVETSADPYVAKLIQIHAEVIGAFIENGHAEAMKDHPVPPAVDAR